MRLIITNKGPATVTLIGVWIATGKKGLNQLGTDTFVESAPQLPQVLTRGLTWTADLQGTVITSYARAMTPEGDRVRFRYIAVDSANNAHRSKWITVT